MANSDSTVDVSYFRPAKDGEAKPGLLLIVRAGEPSFEAHRLRVGELEVGRMAPAGITVDDRAMSRRHARVRWVADRFEVEDLGSRNGLVVDGVAVKPGDTAVGTRSLRLGQTILVFCPDLSPLLGDGPRVEDGIVIGPRLRLAWRAIEDIAETSRVLHLRGESGVGKELAAERFHRASRETSGAFVPVNCAAIPHGVAERLLFGARKGAFSGAHADAEGLVQAAHGGTLFLDEVGELELDVQAKFLRVLESRTVMPVGDVKSRPVEFRLVSATHKDLRGQIAERTFREDLFYRLGRPEVQLPSLRDRPEEIPYLVRMAVGDMPVSPDFIEACLLRPWPGNVRELLLEAKEAARQASMVGAESLAAAHLSGTAGIAHTTPPPQAKSRSGKIDKSMLPSRETIEEALRDNDGKVATTARQLGVHRNQLRRWLKENEVDPTQFSSGEDD